MRLRTVLPVVIFNLVGTATVPVAGPGRCVSIGRAALGSAGLHLVGGVALLRPG